MFFRILIADKNLATGAPSTRKWFSDTSLLNCASASHRGRGRELAEVGPRGDTGLATGGAEHANELCHAAKREQRDAREANERLLGVEGREVSQPHA